MPDEQQPDTPVDAGGATSADASRGTKDAKPDGKTPDGPDSKAPAGKASADKAEQSTGPLISSYGLLSAVLGLVAVAAVVFGLITWSMHQSDKHEREYKSRVLQTAASWTSVLINLNAENVEKGMQRLHDKTVGELNGEFEVAMQPYRDVVQRIQSRSSGRIEAVAIESVRYNPEGDANTIDSADRPAPDSPGRTDAVTVVATSIAENVGGKPQTVHWALELDVTDVDSRLLISRLRSIR